MVSCDWFSMRSSGVIVIGFFSLLMSLLHCHLSFTVQFQSRKYISLFKPAYSNSAKVICRHSTILCATHTSGAEYIFSVKICMCCGTRIACSNLCTPSLPSHFVYVGSRDGAVVRALASHQCGAGSIPRLDSTSYVG